MNASDTLSLKRGNVVRVSGRKFSSFHEQDFDPEQNEGQRYQTDGENNDFQSHVCGLELNFSTKVQKVAK